MSHRSNFLLDVFNKYNITPSRGKGSYIFDTSGKRYLDFTSGVGVLSLGHCHPSLIRVLVEQSHTMWHCSNLFHVEKQEHLAQLLVDKSGFAHCVFFCNSGAEAVECALKAAWFYGENFSRNKIICFQGCFHGRTYATLHASQYQCGPFHNSFIHVSSQISISDLHDIIDDKVVAIIIEPVQGEGGCYAFSHEFLCELRRITHQKQCLLIYDEVQCGYGRTGIFYDYLWAGNKCLPDVLCLAKGMGGGFPIGACLVSKEVSLAFKKGSHGSTFGGNPLGVSIAIEVFQHISCEKFLDNVRCVSSFFMRELRTIRNYYQEDILSIEGRGLLIGIRMASHINISLLLHNLLFYGIIALRSRDNTLRILPPLNTSFEEVITFLEIFFVCFHLCKKDIYK